MLFNFDWLKPGKLFPPDTEASRLERYMQNAQLFDGEHFAGCGLRTSSDCLTNPVDIYLQCAKRISRVIGNWEDVISFPTLLNYQRFMSLKMADLVCGEHPLVSAVSEDDNKEIERIRDFADFDSRLYATVIDISRFGDAIWRVYKDDKGKATFTCWNPTQWFPIISQDGTFSILCHCICWRENRSLDPLNPDWVLHVQKHWNQGPKVGTFDYEIYKMKGDGRAISELESHTRVRTGFDSCAVMHLKSFDVTGTVFGYDDYVPLDSLLAEIMVRIGQISAILDKHADPNITGPATMLELNVKTGEYYFKGGKYFVTAEGEPVPQYMTWDGHLDAAFKHLEFLINQLYILSEMGAALLGGMDGSGTAISGTAMRFKMVNPLAKARRVANSLTKPVRKLFTMLSSILDYEKLSVFWYDGLPDDQRENIECARLATGATNVMPLNRAVREFFNRSQEEADAWVKEIEEETKKRLEQQAGVSNRWNDPISTTNKVTVNPAKKGSSTGLTSFHGLNNNPGGTK